MSSIEYNKLGSIVSITTTTWRDRRNCSDLIDKFIIVFDSGKKLILSYTEDCCEVSWFDFHESSLDEHFYDDDWSKLFVGRTIESIDHLKDKDIGGSPDHDYGLGKDYQYEHYYKITFTDGNHVTIVLYCVSNGYYDSSLLTKIQ